MYSEHYSEKQVVGRGKYGTPCFFYFQGVVCIVTRANSDDPTLYAAKKIRMSGLNEKEKQAQLKELHILQTLKHPSVVQLIDFFSDEDTLVLVMEYCESTASLHSISP